MVIESCHKSFVSHIFDHHKVFLGRANFVKNPFCLFCGAHTISITRHNCHCHLINVMYGYICGNFEIFPFGIVIGILLEASLEAILEHVFESFVRIKFLLPHLILLAPLLRQIRANHAPYFVPTLTFTCVDSQKVTHRLNLLVVSGRRFSSLSFHFGTRGN